MVRISAIFKLWIMLVLLDATGVLSAFNINSSLFTYFIDLSPLMMFVIVRFVPSLFEGIKHYTRRLDKFIFLYIGFWCVEIIYTLFIYRGQFSISPVMLVRKNLYWLDVLMVYALLYIFEQDGGIDAFLNNIIVIAVINNLQRFAAWFGFTNGITIFPSIIKDGLSIRNGSVYRLGGSSITSLAYDLSIYNHARSERRKKVYLIIAVLFFIYQAVIGQSRAHIIGFAVVACFGGYFLLTQRYEQYHKQYKVAMLIIIFSAIAYLLFNGYLQNFVGSFSTTADSYTAGSTINRLYAVEYYWSLMKEKIWLGLGFIYDDSDTVGVMFRYLRGNGMGGVAYLEDLGFLGQFFQVGILGSLVLLSIFKRLYTNARTIAKYNSLNGAAMTMIFIHVIINSVTTLSIFLKNLFYLVPLYLAISEYFYDKDVSEYELYNCDDSI